MWHSWFWRSILNSLLPWLIWNIKWDEAINDSLAALKLFSDWFVKSKMIKKVYTALYADDNILYFNEDSGNVVFSWNETGVLNVSFYNVKLDDSFDEDDPDAITPISCL